jgi:hypothetical protein
VTVGEVLADGDALAVGDAFLVGVGFGDFTGCGLKLGLSDGVGYTATTLGGGDDRGCWLAIGDGLALGELRCCAVLLPVCPLACPAM